MLVRRPLRVGVARFQAGAETELKVAAASSGLPLKGQHSEQTLVTEQRTRLG